MFLEKTVRIPLVSVVIPCYNYGRFIEDAIDSVLASTYQYIEIIVVDDGPTDSFTIDLLQKLDKPKTKVIFQENQGLARARNNGISQARGEFILPLDADDKIDPTYIEKALYVLKKNPNLGSAYGYAQVFGSQELLWKTGEYSIEKLTKENIMPSCSLFRKKVWKKVGGYENDRYQYDDWTFWLKLASHGFYGKLIPEALFFHRKHLGQENMTERLREKHEEYYNKIKQKFPNFFGKKFKFCSRFYKIFSMILHRILPKKIATLLFGVKCKLARLVQGGEKDSDFEMINCGNYSKKTDKLLVFLPWIIRGGAEKVTLDIIKNLADWDIFVITTLENEYDSVVDLDFKNVTKNVYHLPNFLDREDYLPFVQNLIKQNDISIALINHCAWAYENMEKIKKISPSIKFFDLLHNASLEGYKNYSVKYNEFISKTVAINREIEKHLINDLKISEKKVDCILNGIDLDGVFNPINSSIPEIKKELGFPENKFIVSFIGRMGLEKNPLKFINIAKELKKQNPSGYFFVMSGGGGLADDVKNEIRKNFNGDEFIHLGNYHNSEKILALADVLVNTSSIEGMPLTILEAFAMEVPVVAPNIGGIHEIVEDGKNGYLLTAQPSVDEYVQAIEKMGNSGTHASMKKNARQSVSSFSSVKMAEKYRQLFKAI